LEHSWNTLGTLLEHSCSSPVTCCDNIATLFQHSWDTLGTLLKHSVTMSRQFCNNPVTHFLTRSESRGSDQEGTLSSLFCVFAPPCYCSFSLPQRPESACVISLSAEVVAVRDQEEDRESQSSALDLAPSSLDLAPPPAAKKLKSEHSGERDIGEVDEDRAAPCNS
jgi:hypothetical protein